MSKHTPLDRLKHHVTGAIERGEKEAIEAVVAPKHTPGPWFVKDNLVRTNEGPTGQYHREICCVGILWAYSNQPEAKANAQLIAAAPELLQALKQIADPIRLRDTGFLASNPPQNAAVWDIQAIARAAIAKAEGRIQ